MTRFEGLLVTHQVDLPDGSAIVVTAPRFGADRLANLARVGAEGRVVWRVEPPKADPADAWVEVHETSDKVVYASTWSCHLVEVDLATGSALSISFTK